MFPVSQASADGSAEFDDAEVTVSPDCSGVMGASAITSPVQQSDYVGPGIDVRMRFDAFDKDESCFAAATISWRNLDTGASGTQHVTVPSVPDPGIARHYGWRFGIAAVKLRPGAGTVAVSVSTNPNPPEVRIII
ncbi:hypothetical protein BB28_04810 [Mycobacteroides chelonae CCUG 47445]|nr:hypothetical protein BB28_04810 [Mycobacteroides chelonae CCUG 47445]